MEEKGLTNRERALDQISEMDLPHLMFNPIFDSVELASQIDWYKPKEGEFPKDNSDIVTNRGNVYWFINKDEPMMYHGAGVDIKIEHIEAWTYLPEYKNR